MVDTKVTLYDGKYHDVDSSTIAFEIAARQGMREGCMKAGVKLLEPIMDVEVVVPEEYLGDVLGDLVGRRGQVAGTAPRAGATVIAAQVPLAELFGYATKLRSVSQGRAVYSMQFSRYHPVPAGLAETIVAQVGVSRPLSD
jgi:elongation factor G